MKVFGLIGKSLNHSFSKQFFTDKFIAEGSQNSYKYDNFELKSIQHFPSLVSSLKNSLGGLNVTIPYKEQVIPFLDEIDVHAMNIKAVNTIAVDSQLRLTGFNTDFLGVLDSLDPQLLTSFKIKRAFILGSGGASKAVAYACKFLGIFPEIVSRNPTKEQVSYKELNKILHLKEPILLVNTTPKGTWPNIDEIAPFNFNALHKKVVCFDLIYNPKQTRFLHAANSFGCHTQNGLKMLKSQALHSWKCWSNYQKLS